MNLDKYSKSDILFILQHIRKRNPEMDYYIKQALNDLEYHKELDRINQAEKQIDISKKEMEKYVDLLKPYEGKRITDIPDAILKEASEALKKSEKANKKYAKLMELEGVK